MGSLADHQDDYSVKPGETWQQYDGRIPKSKWEQVPPCSVSEQIKGRIDASTQKGIDKYGVTLDRPDLSLREWLCHALEECLDQAKYLQKAINELDGK